MKKTLLLISQLLISVVAMSMLSACTIHQLDIQQGNVITKEMTDKLKIGMNKDQVKFILGTASISDPFHKDRWDYVYSLKDMEGLKETSHITVLFKNEKVVQYVGVDIAANAKLASKNIEGDSQAN